jgi:hydroxyacylglutathione hydrolase
MNDRFARVIPIKAGIARVFIIRGSKPVLVDNGQPGKEAGIIKAIIQKGIRPEEIPLIILTHGHDDHFGCAEMLREVTKAKILMHEADANNLRKGENGQLNPTGWFGRIVSFFIRSGPKVKGIEPDILIQEEFDLYEYGIQGKVIHTPGHTPGSLSVLLDSGEVIVGDLIMSFFPRKQPGYPIFAADLSQVKSSIAKVVKYNPKRFYCSHGGPYDPKAVYNAFKDHIG